MGHALHDRRVPTTHMLPVQAVFPFVKLFGPSRLLAFEVSASVLLIWCRGWFRHAPAPPAKLLAATVAAAGAPRSFGGCPAVVQHAEHLGVDPGTLVWPLLFSLCSEVLEGPEWLKLWDFLICYPEHPEFLALCAVAVLRLHSNHLLDCEDAGALSQVLRRVAPRLKAASIVRLVRRLYANLTASQLLALRPDAEHDAVVGVHAAQLSDGFQTCFEDNREGGSGPDIDPAEPWFLASSIGEHAYREFPRASQKCLNLQKQQLEGIARFQQDRAEHAQLMVANEDLEDATLAAVRQTDLEQRRLIDAMTKATLDAAADAEGAVDAIRAATMGAGKSAGGAAAFASEATGKFDHRYNRRELERLRRTYVPLWPWRAIRLFLVQARTFTCLRDGSLFSHSAAWVMP